MMSPSGPPGDPVPQSFASTTAEAWEPAGSSSSQVSKDKRGWVQRTAASVSSVTGRVTSTVKAPGSYLKKAFGGNGRSAVNPISLAATKARLQTRRMLRQDGLPTPSMADLSSTLEMGGSSAVPGDDDSKRTVLLDGGRANPGFSGNRVLTAKYNVLTFLPIFLYEMFSRVAYLYFLLQAALSWWSTISPFGGWGATMALLFVLLVGGVKAVWEDSKRHAEDRTMNSSTAHVVQPDGSVVDVQWREVQVGQVLMVRDDELFPADLLCLHSDLPDNVCFIKTTNLDGESNLKIRKPVGLREAAMSTREAVMGVQGQLTVELPSANLHYLKGTFTYTPPAARPRRLPITMNEMLLRGCTLKNSHHVLGLVVYTGPQTRIQMNAAKTPLKIGSFDRFLNLQILLVVMMQLTMCLVHSIANQLWRHSTGTHRVYLGFWANVNGVYESNFVYWLISFLTFWVLYSYLVPISLFVTMEIVKFWQGFVFINADKEMRDPATKEWARCRNSNLNEDLGKVEYVFSDKTGTLTSNEMQLRMVAIKGAAYGNMNWRLEEHREVAGEAALRAFDPRLAEALAHMHGAPDALRAALHAGGSEAALLRAPKSKGAAMVTVPLHDDAPDRASSSAAPHLAAPLTTRTLRDSTTALVLAHHLLDFWTNICVCHSLIVEAAPDGGLPLYQGPSPDEVALVEAARQLGFEFTGRSSSGVSLSLQGHQVKHELLNVMEFTSERGCMSVIARAPDGTIRLYSKGSDASMMGRMRANTDATLVDETNRNLHLFATQGLRTLVLGTKVIAEDVFAEWDLRYQEAAAVIDERDTLLAALADEIEQGLELVGVTAIEDKLQEGVPQAIATLLDANIRVWMITGDKQETAINIGLSCKLIRKPDTLLVCNGTSYQEAKSKLEGLQQRMQAMEAESSAKGLPQVGELVIDGKTLSFVLGSDLEDLLARVGAACGSVIICRASPSQKAAIVRMIMEYELQLASGSTTGLRRWLRRYNKRMTGKLLSIGDGANDVAMIQVADIGVGIMGKEGRQAVNNSDYAFSQFRFLTRLLLVHGTLSHYRLARLIKYSFYKNITFAFVLFYFQFFSGYSGQTLVDGIPAAVYNVVFTSLPILFFALLDRPVKYLTTLMRYPQMYNKQASLTTAGFWRVGVLNAISDAAIVFFVPYFAIRSDGPDSVTDVFSLGKVVYIGLLGVITLHIMIVSRYWTTLFLLAVVLSYALCFVFFAVYPWVQLGLDVHDPTWAGSPYKVLGSWYFWWSILGMYAITGGMRFFQRAFTWIFFPQDTMILTEKEQKEGGPLGGDMTWQVRQRLESLLSTNVAGLHGANGDAPHGHREDPVGTSSSERGDRQNGVDGNVNGNGHCSEGGEGPLSRVWSANSLLSQQSMLPHNRAKSDENMDDGVAVQRAR